MNERDRLRMMWKRFGREKEDPDVRICDLAIYACQKGAPAHMNRR